MEGALRYEVLVRPLGGDVQIDQSTEDTNLVVTLAPGTYQVRVVSYNLFDKPASYTGWRTIEVVRVFIPVVSKVSPTVLYAGTIPKGVLLDGADFLDETTVALVLDGSVAAKTSIDETTAKRIIFSVDLTQAVPGSYTLRVANPEGLVLEVPSAFEVRPRIQPQIDSADLAAGYNDRIYRARKVVGAGFEDGTLFALDNESQTIQL
ncbi:MAG TPA: hypothetical protein VMW69_13850, partial [Spirochaetia bacterium]|nr:hypothetical protein [Spirochaetia bacterium]